MIFKKRKQWVSPRTKCIQFKRLYYDEVVFFPHFYLFISLVVLVRGSVKNLLYFTVDLFFMSSCNKIKHWETVIFLSGGQWVKIYPVHKIPKSVKLNFRIKRRQWSDIYLGNRSSRNRATRLLALQPHGTACSARVT